MSEETRIYREYCWFALFLFILTIGFVGRPPPGGSGTPANAGSVASAPSTSAPPAPHPQ